MSARRYRPSSATEDAGFIDAVVCPPYYIKAEYTTIAGMVWTCDIEVLEATEEFELLVESAFLFCHNITPNRRIEGEIVTRIYADPEHTFLLDTHLWEKISKDAFRYITRC